MVCMTLASPLERSAIGGWVGSQRIEEEVSRRTRELVLPHFLALHGKAVEARMDRAAYPLGRACMRTAANRSH
jgi:hypothetical protein